MTYDLGGALNIIFLGTKKLTDERKSNILYCKKKGLQDSRDNGWAKIAGYAGKKEMEK